MNVATLKLKKLLTDAEAEKLQKQFITDACIEHLITDNADGYDLQGNLLFRFRKSVIPIDVLLCGVNGFRNSISRNDGRGASSGIVAPRILQDGSISKRMASAFVESGVVGYMDRNNGGGGLNNYCRLTSFTKQHFEKFTQGIPFVQHIDGLYADLCPDHYKRQRAIADATNRNYVIEGTSFTTVTVNKNFRTAVHKDSGDFMQGFGNLCVYREGHYQGCYFTLPQYGVGFDLHNGDMLFVDVHQWHGNTEFINADPNFLRISFVMYYRENMIDCKQPNEELARVKHITGNFFKI